MPKSKKRKSDGSCTEEKDMPSDDESSDSSDENIRHKIPKFPGTARLNIQEKECSRFFPESREYHDIESDQSRIPFRSLESREKFVASLLTRPLSISNLKFFMEAAQKYTNGTSKWDVVGEYLQKSGSCSEILDTLISGTRLTVHEKTIVFETLEKILIRTADDLKLYQSSGVGITCHLLQKCLGSIYFMLSQTKATPIKVTLKLLVAVVSQGAQAAREMATCFDFEKVSFHLMQRRDSRDPCDVRTCFLHFITSFFLVGDNAIIYQIMKIKGLLNGIFPGLPLDRASVINLFLTILETKVIYNPSISKTVKVRLFNENTLKYVLQLYSWRGPGKRTKKPKSRKQEDTEINIMEASNEDIILVQDMAHKFMKSLCCSYKYGIIFHDSSVGSSGKNCNHIITNLLTSIKNPYAGQRIRDLVTSILQICPDQLKFYLPSLKASLVPRMSSNWFQAIDFLKQIVSAQDPVGIISKSDVKRFTNLSRLVGMILMLCIPSVISGSTLTEALQASHPMIRHSLLDYLIVTLKKAKEVLTFYTSIQINETHNKSEITEFIHSLTEALKRNLPSMPTILDCWDKLVTFGLKVPEESGEYSKGDIPSASISEHFSKVLQVLKNLCNLLPHSHTESPPHIGTLLSGIKKFASEMSSDEYCSLQLQIINIMTSGDHTSKDLLEKVEGESPFHLLLDVIHTTQYEDLSESVKGLLKSFFADTGLFSNCEWEIDIWIKAIKKIHGDEYIANIHLLELALKKLLDEPYRYTNSILECMAKVTVNFKENIYNLPSNLNDVLNTNVDEHNITLSSSNEASQKQLNSQQPFSPLIPAVLSTINDIDEQNRAICCAYVETVCREVLHHQYYPQALCILLNKYRSYLSEKFQSYTSLWLSEKTMSPGKKLKHFGQVPVLGQKPSFSDILQEAFMTIHFMKSSFHESNTVKIFKTIGRSTHEIEIDELLSTTSQILLYLKMEADEIMESKTNGTEFQLYVDLLKALICHSCQICIENGEFDDHNILGHEENLHHLMTPKLLQLFSCILHYPFISDWFLKIYENSREENISEECSQYLSTFVIFLLNSYWPSNEMNIVEKRNLLQPFKQKVLNYFKNEISSPSRNNNTSKKFVLLSSLLEPFYDLLTYEEVIMLLKLLTAGSSEPLYNSDPELIITTHLMEKYLIKCKCEHLNTLSPHSLNVLFCAFLSSEDIECNLQEILLRLFEDSPLHCFLVNADVVERLLKVPSVQNSSFLDTLTDYCPAHLLTVQCFFINCPDSLQHWQSNDIIHFFNKWWNTSLYSFEKSDNVHLKACISVYWEAVKEELSSFQDDVVWNDLDITEVLSDLLKKKYLDLQEVFLFAEEILFKSSSGVPGPQKLNFIKQFFECLQSTRKRISSLSPGTALLKMMVSWLTVILGEKNENNDIVILDYTSETQNILEPISQEEITELLSCGNIWQKFLRNSLKRALRNTFIGTPILSLVNSVYAKVHGIEENSVKSLSSEVFQMVFGHSSFLNIMLEENVEFESLKDAVVTLWITLVSNEKTICKAEHIPILLASYQATQRNIDEKLLYLMKLYERNNVSMYEFRPFLWGKAAITHYSVRKNISLSLWKEPRMAEVLNLLVAERVMETATHFPLDIALEPVLPNEIKDKNHQSNYDPRFFLPLFCQLLSPGSLVHCLTFIESKCLAFTFASLGSNDCSMRAAGYCVLSQFYQHLEGSLYANKKLWLTVLDSVMNAIEIPNARLPCIITLFLCKMTEILFKPDHPLYCTLYKFLLSKPCLDLGHVPEFYKLFNSISPDYRLHHNWIFSLIAKGLRTSLDFHICEKRYIFNLILPFYASPICNQDSKVSILSIIHSAVKIYSSAQTLCRNGLLIWFHNIVSNSNPDEEIIAHLCCILDALWEVSLNPVMKSKNKKIPRHVDNGKIKETTVEVKAITEPDFPSETEKTRVFYNSFSSEIFTLQLDMLSKLSAADIVYIHKYLKTFLSVLNAMNENSTSTNVFGDSSLLTTWQIEKLLDLWAVICKNNSVLHSASSDINNDFLKNHTSYEKSSDSNVRLVKNVDNLVAYIDCQEILVEVFMFWQPKWKSTNINNDNHLQTISLLIKTLLVIFQVGKQDAVYLSKLTEWLHDILQKDEQHDLFRVFLSTSEDGRRCFELFLFVTVNLLNTFRTLVSDKRTTRKIQPEVDECDYIFKALCHCTDILQMLAVYTHHTKDPSDKPLHKTYQNVLKSNYFTQESKHLIYRKDLEEVQEKLQLLLEFWLRKPKPVLHKHFSTLRAMLVDKTTV